MLPQWILAFWGYSKETHSEKEIYTLSGLKWAALRGQWKKMEQPVINKTLESDRSGVDSSTISMGLKLNICFSKSGVLLYDPWQSLFKIGESPLEYKLDFQYILTSDVDVCLTKPSVSILFKLRPSGKLNTSWAVIYFLNTASKTAGNYDDILLEKYFKHSAKLIYMY